MSLAQNVKSVSTNDLVGFIKSANLLAQADILSISKLFRSVCTLFSFSQTSRNAVAAKSPLYSADIPSNLFIDNGDAIDLCFCLSVAHDDEAVKFTFEIGGFEIYQTSELDLAGDIIARISITKFGTESLRMSGELISSVNTPQVLAVFDAGTGGFDFTTPLSFVLSGEATDELEAVGLGGKISYNPA